MQSGTARKATRYALGVAVLSVASVVASAQVNPLAPRWVAGDPTPPVETFADSLARHHIDVTEPALIAALGSSDGEVRSLAAAQLAAMDDHPALPAVMRALDSERDSQVEVNIAGAATWLGSRRALDQLQQVCHDVNVPSVVRLDAARYVSNREVASCYADIEQIEHTEQVPATRVLAIEAAESYRGQGEKAAALAISALADLEPSVRIAAADAIRHLRATDATRALNKVLQIEGDDTAREHIREAIRALSLVDTSH